MRMAPGKTLMFNKQRRAALTSRALSRGRSGRPALCGAAHAVSADSGQRLRRHLLRAADGSFARFPVSFLQGFQDARKGSVSAVRRTVGSNELADLLQVRGVKAIPVELCLQKERFQT